MTDSTLVISPSPLPEDSRRRLREAYGGDVRFSDLMSLRRSSLRDAVASLRMVAHRLVLVTAQDETQGRLFQDILCLLAILATGDQRQVLEPPGTARRLSRLSAPLHLVRIACSTVFGWLSMAANSWESRRLHSKGLPPPIGPSVPEKCLYLRPTFMIGTQVGGSIGHVVGVANAFARRLQTLRLLTISGLPMINSDVSQVIVPPQFSACYPNELNQHRYQRTFHRRALEQARAIRPDFIYQRYSANDLSGARLRKRLRVPLILEFNGSEVWVQDHWGKPLRFRKSSERIEEICLRSADLVVVVSEEVARQVQELGIPQEKVLVHPNCVDASLFDPGRFSAQDVMRVRHELGVPLDADLFTFIGTFGHWHGTGILAEAIRRLVEGNGRLLQERRIHFLLVGDGPLAEAARRDLSGSPYSAFVAFAGVRPQEETPATLYASDVLLSPHVPNPDGTPFFGSPTKLFEYMAMSRLIIASDLDQIGSVLRVRGAGAAATNEPAAILVRPGDADSLAAAILTASEMPPEERCRYGKITREQVLRSFTWDRNVDVVLRALQQVLSHHPRSERLPQAVTL